MNRIRNPFNKKPPLPDGLTSAHDENLPSATASDSETRQANGLGSRTSSSVNIRKKEEPGEYKLSVVNDSGIYLPPSPPEKKSFWPRSPLASRTNSHRSVLNENEPFSISRESFESYRRSFDISAKSPISQTTGSTPRQSLDAKLVSSPRPAMKNSGQFERPPPTNEEEGGFEDIGLNGNPDDNAKSPGESSEDAKQTTKRKSIFGRFGDTSNEASNTSGDTQQRPSSSHRGFHLPGRKRGQSGQGAELGDMDGNTTSNKAKEDSVIR